MKTLYLSIITALGIGGGIFLVYSHANLSPLTTADNGSGSYTVFDAVGLRNTYHVGETANFTLVVRGHGKFPCTTPAIKIYNDATPGEPIFDVKSAYMSCDMDSQSRDFQLYFPSKTGSFSASLNQTGNYTLEISYGRRTILDGFTVVSGMPEEHQFNRTVTVNVGEKQAGGILPVVIVQNMSSNTYFPNKLTVWDIHFEPYLHPGYDQTRMTTTIPLSLEVTDKNQQNILYQGNFLISDDVLYSIPVSCVHMLTNAEFGNFILHIRNTTSVTIKYSDTALQPGPDGAYHLKFSSLPDVKINLPSNAHVTADTTNVCYEKNTDQQVNLYDISFNLEG